MLLPMQAPESLVTPCAPTQTLQVGQYQYFGLARYHISCRKAFKVMRKVSQGDVAPSPWFCAYHRERIRQPDGTKLRVVVTFCTKPDGSAGVLFDFAPTA